MRQASCMIFDSLRDVDGRKVVLIFDEQLSPERQKELEQIATKAREQATKLLNHFRETGK